MRLSTDPVSFFFGGSRVPLRWPGGYRLRGDPNQRSEQLGLRIGNSDCRREYFQTFNWFNDAGVQAHIGDLRKHYPELQLQTLKGGVLI